MSRLEDDPIYPPGLFVPQRLAYRVGLDPFEAEDALEALDSWLGQEGPQLLLVLGEALGEHVQRRGFRMLRLVPFDAGRIHRFLVNRFGDVSVAQQRFALIDEVKDLLGLSHNPRMLGFIAEIDEQDLRAAAEGGAITSATLYRVLLGNCVGVHGR